MRYNKKMFIMMKIIMIKIINNKFNRNNIKFKMKIILMKKI